MMIIQQLLKIYVYKSVVYHHRLRGSASPMLMATHHSNGSPKLSDFFPAHSWRSDRPTDFDAKWVERRTFMQGCDFCSKNRNFSYPLISRALKGQNFANFGKNFSLDSAFNPFSVYPGTVAGSTTCSHSVYPVTVTLLQPAITSTR